MTETPAQPRLHLVRPEQVPHPSLRHTPFWRQVRYVCDACDTVLQVSGHSEQERDAKVRAHGWRLRLAPSVGVDLCAGCVQLRTPAGS